MPSAISLKKLTASNWSAKNEVDSAPVEGDTAQSDKHKQDIKSKKKSDRGDGRSLTSRIDVETILDAKRKRTVPLAKQQLTEWLKANFEPMEDGYLSGRKMYEFYKQNCILQGMNVLELTLFNRQLNSVLGGKKYLIKEGSDYKGLVSEKKKKETKKTESLHHKMKDIIIESLKEGGSPKKGLRFVWIKHYIMAKYPALRLDLKPGYLKVALERAVRFGFVELVRGMGMSGYYRLPGEYPEDEEDEKKKNKKKAKKQDEGGKEKEGGENGIKEREGAKAGEEAQERHTKEEKDVNGKEEGAGKGEKKEAKKSKKKKHSFKRKPRPQTSYGVSRHVEPRTIDDVFPMAMTFMCEPKDASSVKIKKYIHKYFPSVDLETNFKKTLLNGCEKGLWEQVTGTGSSGSFRLQVDDINPLRCTTLEDMICLAILACHEPKKSSVNLLKQYIMEYHPNFNIDKRPYHFKRALEKAERNGKIIRLSGIGSTGSFQLSEPFTPCPSWLGGEEDSDIEEDIEEVTQVQEEQLYKVRPSKRRGMGRAAAAKGRTPDFISYTSPTKPKKRKRKVSYKEEEESEGEVEEPPKRSKSRTKKSASKSRSRKPTAEGEEDEEEVEEDEPAEYTPKKTASRGGFKPSSHKQKSRSKTSEKSSKAGKSKQKSSTPSKSSRKAPKVRQEEEEDTEEPVQKKKEASKKGKSPSRKSATKGPSKSKSSQREESLVDEEELETKSRSSRKKSRVDYKEGEQDSDGEEELTRKVKGSSYKRRAQYSDSEDEGQVTRKSRAKRSYDEDESLSEEEELPVKSRSRKSSSKKAPTEQLYTDSEEDGEVTARRKLYDSDDAEEEERPSKSSKKLSKKSSKKRR